MNLNLTYGNFTVPKFFLHNIFINKMRTKKNKLPYSYKLFARQIIAGQMFAN